MGWFSLVVGPLALGLGNFIGRHLARRDFSHRKTILRWNLGVLVASALAMVGGAYAAAGLVLIGTLLGTLQLSGSKLD